MRPIVRGTWPQNAAGQNINFKEYAYARGELIRRLGEYCSYCEMELDTSLAVEHVQPKRPPGAAQPIAARELDWNNFLLACTSCNSTKGDIDVVLDDHLWPHRDNTFRALCYSEGGLVTASTDQSIDDAIRQKADSIIKLTGLDKDPSNDDPKASDRRLQNRRETWDIAKLVKEMLARNYNEDFKELIVITARAKGYWSVWMTVFKDDADMLDRLIKAFPGTCCDCFDSTAGLVPIARAGGQC